MPIYSVSFKRLTAEKKKPLKGEINARTNIQMIDLEKADPRTIRIGFLYQTEYDPEVGIIEIAGDMYYSEEEQEIDKIEKYWKENNKLEEELSIKVLNKLFAKCSPQAVILTNDIGLPVPFNLPKFTKKQKA